MKRKEFWLQVFLTYCATNEPEQARDKADKALAIAVEKWESRKREIVQVFEEDIQI